MTSMIDIRAMTEADAGMLQALMAAEKPDYLQHFTAFKEQDSLLMQCRTAQGDGFFALLLDGCLSGFFCLRGLDQGYARPSFGVYVTSSFQGQGLARAALQAAEQWCRQQGVSVLMLKVSAHNERASRLYQLFGFESVGRCPDSGQTIMEKRID
jgi:RimJ/RimL family protein N-acetyltransferase